MIGLDAFQATYAENTTYYPAGQAEPQIPSTVTRDEVRTEALVANQAPRTTWTEFGAGSHNESLSTQTRAQVKSQAETVEHPQQRSYFNY